MKMIKKLSVVSLALTLAVGGAGCAKKELPVDTTTPTDSATTVNESGELEPEPGAKLLAWIDNEKYGQALVEGFNKKYPDIEVEIQEKASVESAGKIELDGPAGNGADVFMLPHDRVIGAIDSGILLPIDPSAVKVLEEKTAPNALKTVQYDGNTYGVPVAVESVGIFYNKDLVTEPAKTFEEIFEFAKIFNNPQDNKFAFAMDIANAYTAYGLLTPYGFQLFGDDGTNVDDPGFASEEFLKGLEFIQSINKILPVQTSDLKGEFIGEQFKAGKIAYILDGPWKIEDFRKAGMNIGVMTIPTINGNTPTPFAGVQNMHVSAYTKYPNAATLFAEYAGSEEGANILYQTVYKAPALKDTSVVEGLNEDEFLPVFVEQFQDAFPMPSHARMSYYWSIGEKAISLVFNGQVTPEEAQKAAVDEWNSLVASE